MCCVMVEKVLVMVVAEAAIFRAATDLRQQWYKLLPDFAIIVILCWSAWDNSAGER